VKARKLVKEFLNRSLLRLNVWSYGDPISLVRDDAILKNSGCYQLCMAINSLSRAHDARNGVIHRCSARVQDIMERRA
jgi:hypothetical protein